MWLMVGLVAITSYCLKLILERLRKIKWKSRFKCFQTVKNEVEEGRYGSINSHGVSISTSPTKLLPDSHRQSSLINWNVSMWQCSHSLAAEFASSFTPFQKGAVDIWTASCG